jgi:dolichol-phosphate mannosyltransferase
MRIIVCIPTYNERENIGLLLDMVEDVAKLLRPYIQLDIFVLDDNSPDKTYEIVEEYQNRYDNIFLRVRHGKMGLGSAIRDCIYYSLEHDYDAMVIMDADLQHPPIYIPFLISKISEGYDLVIASRYVGSGGIFGWGYIRKIVSFIANFLSSLILGLPVKDATSGYRAYSRRAMYCLRERGFITSGYSTQVEIIYILYRGGFRVVEIPFVFRGRYGGRSKLSVMEVVKFLFTMLLLRRVHR